MKTVAKKPVMTTWDLREQYESNPTIVYGRGHYPRILRKKPKVKKVICLAGPSGSGKTYMRQTDKKLKDLPAVDVADVYRETWLRPPYDWERALKILLHRAQELLKAHDTVVVEAYFSPGSRARDIVTKWAWHNKLKLEWIDLWPMADYKVCRQRVIDSGIEVRERLLVLDRVFGRR